MTPSHCSTTAVPVGNLRSEILVVQSTQNWHCQGATDSLDGTRNRRVLVQRQVRTSLVVIFLVRIEQMVEVSFTKHNDVIDTLPSDRTNQPFRISVLPWRSGRCRSISDAHGANTPKEHLAIGSIAIMDQVVRSLLPSAGLDQLPGNPFRSRMCCGP